MRSDEDNDVEGDADQVMTDFQIAQSVIVIKCNAGKTQLTY